MKNILKSYFFVIMLALVACSDQLNTSTPTNVKTMIARNDWAGAVAHYRSALEKDPGNVALKTQYYSIAERAVNYHLDAALKSQKDGNINSAEAFLSRGLLIVPNAQILREELEKLNDAKRADALYRDALVNQRLGRISKAIELLEKALSLNPYNQKAVSLFNELYQQSYNETDIRPIRLKTGALITVNFKKASFKDAFLAFGSAYGVNIIFDADVDDRPISMTAEGVSFEQAFNLLLKANHSFYRRLGQNSILIVPDNPDKRAEYEDYMVRTFFLKSAKADAISQILSTTLGLQNISVNARANSITIRDTRERLALADTLISNNDRSLPEVIMEVEILEVNRTKSERLGVDFGSQIRITPPSATVGDLFSGGAGDLLKASAVTLPATTLRYFKQDVDAVTLASPRIRTVHENEASIHIGDKVPLRSSTIQDATGQTRTTFEYRDVGIKLKVTPDIGLNNSVTVKLHLEVSSLGQNLGTADEPAFSIGTRNVETEMTLQNGETVLIGGLIRDEQRETIQKVPGLGKIPAIGRIFRSREGQKTRTDILLTITPRIVRGWDLPSAAESQFYSGTGQRVTSARQFEFMLAANAAANAPTIRLDMSGDGRRAVSQQLRRDIESSLPTSTQPASSAAASVSFSENSYATVTGKPVTVTLMATGVSIDSSTTMTVRFNKDLVEVLSFKALGANGMDAIIDNVSGEITIKSVSLIAGRRSAIAEIVFSPLRPGLSYLIYAKPAGGQQGDALPSNIQRLASRIIVR